MTTAAEHVAWLRERYADAVLDPEWHQLEQHALALCDHYEALVVARQVAFDDVMRMLAFERERNDDLSAKYEALVAATREALPWMRDADRSIITKVLGERGSIPASRESSG